MLGLEWWAVVTGIVVLTVVAVYAGPAVFMYTWRRRRASIMRAVEEDLDTKIRTAFVKGYRLRMRHDEQNAESDHDDYH